MMVMVMVIVMVMVMMVVMMVMVMVMVMVMMMVMVILTVLPLRTYHAGEPQFPQLLNRVQLTTEPKLCVNEVSWDLSLGCVSNSAAAPWFQNGTPSKHHQDNYLPNLKHTQFYSLADVM